MTFHLKPAVFLYTIMISLVMALFLTTASVLADIPPMGPQYGPIIPPMPAPTPPLHQGPPSPYLNMIAPPLSHPPRRGGPGMGAWGSPAGGGFFNFASKLTQQLLRSLPDLFNQGIGLFGGLFGGRGGGGWRGW